MHRHDPDRAAPAATSAGDADGAALLRVPGWVDAHIHPDKTTWGGPWLSRSPAHSLRELIAGDLRAQRAATRGVAERAHALLTAALRAGTFAVRAHVDVSAEFGTANVEAVRSAADRLAPELTVQIVAFPQFGLLSNPGTLDAMRAALDAGADLVGGLDPLGIDGDVAGHLDAVFALADRTGRDLDIHLHDGGEAGLAEIRDIAARTVAAGRAGQVTVSHAFALCDSSLPSLDDTLECVARAGVWVTTCALGPDPVPDLDRFERHGVPLALGSDGVRDAWSPFGTGSMLDRAHLLAYRAGARTDGELTRAFRLATEAGAALLGVTDLAAGHATGGDGVEYAVPGVPQLVVDRPAPRRVVRGGRVVVGAESA